MHPEGVGQLPLALTRTLREEPEHACLGWREPERPDAVGECGSGVRAELGEQEGGAAVAL